MMLPVSEGLSKLFAARDLGDPTIRLCRRSALEFHLGRPLLAPFQVSAAKRTKLTQPAGHWLEIYHDRMIGKPLRVDGVLVASITETLCACLDHPTWDVDAESIAGLAQRVAREPRQRRLLIENVTEIEDAASLRRLAYMLERVGVGWPQVLPTHPKTVFLRPGLVAEGSTRSGLVINAPDGVADAGPDAEELALLMRKVSSAPARTLLDVSAIGVELDAVVAEGLVGAEKARAALDELLLHGVMRRVDGSVRPVLPLNSHVLARVVPRPVQTALANRLLTLLEPRKEPRARRNLLRLLVWLHHPDAAARLAREASAALDLGATEEVRSWLTALRQQSEDRDNVDLVRLEIQLLEREGKSREAMGVAREMARKLAHGDKAARRDWLLETARLSWQLGQARKAQATLARIRPLLRGDDSLRARCRWLLLRATIALEQGKLTRARALLKSARATAEMGDDAEALALVLRRIGTMEARAGRPHEARAAYEAALSALARVGAPSEASLEAVLHANLATSQAWLGQFDEAEELYRRALILREGMAIGTLNTRAALALLDVARSRPVPPEGRFGPLAAQAEALHDLRLSAELNIYFAEELLLEHDLTRAARALQHARVALAELGGAETILEHMLVAVDASLRAARGDTFAIARFEAAVLGLEKIGAQYHAARAARMAATAAANLGDDAQAERFLAQSARAAIAGDFVLGAEMEHVVVYTLGSVSGQSWLKNYCDRCLDRLGRARLTSLLAREGREDLAARLMAQGPGPRTVGTRYRCDGPDGSRWLTPAQRQHLLEVREGTVVLDLPDGEIRLSGGRVHDVRKRRVLAPLLAHLASKGPRPCSIAELAREVWQLRPSPSLASAIKMTVARLRKLLAEHGDWVETETSMRGELAYRISEKARLYVISDADAGRSGPPPSG